MKVYIIYEKDGYNGEQVGGVFESLTDAQNEVKKGGYFTNIECHEIQVASQDEDVLNDTLL